MQKKGELSKLAKILIIVSLIILLGVVIFLIFRESKETQDDLDDSSIDLKISEVKKIDDSKLDISVKRNTGKGEFVGLSFVIREGTITEIINVNASIGEEETENFSLILTYTNASKIESISVSPIYKNEEGYEVAGKVKDEYLYLNCIPSCPSGAQCGNDGCGGNCGSGCNSGYSCINYKCVKQSSGGGGGGGSSSDSEDDEGEITTPCTDTCSSLGYTCGTRTICGSNVVCGSCETGYTCAANGTCIKEVVIDCGEISCKSGEYCFNGGCLLNVTGNTYFVATNGDDAWSGNFTHPWATWEKAFTSPSPGDIVYFRGGVYPMTVMNGYGYNSINDGTVGNPIYYWAYPTDFASGNVPILDCENIIPSGDLNHGIYATADYVHFKGLTVRNVFQHDEADEAFGWRIGGLNTTLEMCTAYNVHGVGFRASTNSINMRFINCDAYNMIDYLDEAPLPGNDGYCFQVQNTQTTTGSVYFYGCRAWNCSDDGFTLFSRSYIEIDNCWSFSNGALQGAGNGWKLGFLPDGGNYAPLTRKVTNSIAAYNRASGFTSNDNDNEAVTMQLYNNLVYHNGYSSGYPGISPGFYIYNTAYPDAEELKRVLKNNLAYDNEDGPVRIAEGALYTHEHNSWDSSVTITDEDFVLLPETPEQGFALLSAPRKADGSLPDLGEYFKLTSGSDLIDNGINLGLPYSGSAPDLGAFESNY